MTKLWKNESTYMCYLGVHSQIWNYLELYYYVFVIFFKYFKDIQLLSSHFCIFQPAVILKNAIFCHCRADKLDTTIY